MGNVAATGGGGSPSTYLPTVASSPLMVGGAKRMVSGYNGNLFELSNDGGTTKQSFAAAVGDLPSYSAINTFKGAGTLTVTKIYDQSGNSRDLTNSGTVGFDTALGEAGCSPFQFTGSGYMQGTAGSVSNRNSSFFGIYKMRALNQVKSVLFSFDDGTNVTHGLIIGASNQFSFNSTDAQIVASPKVYPRSNLAAFGLTSNGTNQTYYGNETSSTASNPTSLTGSNFKVGAILAPSWRLEAGVFGFVAYPALSSSDGLSVLTNLRTMFTVPTTFDSRIVFEGDSIMEGDFSTNNQNMINQLSGVHGTPELMNLGNSGDTLAAQAASASTYTALFTSSYGAGKCLIIVETGTNDIATGTTASSLYSTFTSHVSTLKGAGYKVLGTTILPRSSITGSTETQRTTYNTSMRGNAAACDGIVDIADTGTVMGALTAPADTSLYADGTHPTTVGYAHLANDTGLYKDKINTIL